MPEPNYDHKPVVALFDFDGTITLRDTLPLYIRHATGLTGLLLSILSSLPALIILAANGWKSLWGIDAQRTKEGLLRRCFENKSIEQVSCSATEFVQVVNQVISREVYQRMLHHIALGDSVVIVSASPQVWVEPWAMSVGDIKVIATQLEVVNGRYTGRFHGKNCNGQEKVTQIARLFPRSQFHIVAYGNSSGDIPMLSYAHEAYMCSNGLISPYHAH